MKRNRRNILKKIKIGKGMHKKDMRFYCRKCEESMELRLR